MQRGKPYATTKYCCCSHYVTGKRKKIIQRGKFHANENKSKLLSLLLFLQTETEKRKSKLCTRKKSKAGISCVLTRIMRREGHWKKRKSCYAVCSLPGIPLRAAHSHESRLRYPVANKFLLHFDAAHVTQLRRTESRANKCYSGRENTCAPHIQEFVSFVYCVASSLYHRCCVLCWLDFLRCHTQNRKLQYNITCKRKRFVMAEETVFTCADFIHSLLQQTGSEIKQ